MATSRAINWATLAQSAEAAGYEKTSRYWVPLLQALTIVTKAQADLEFACLIMSRSFAIDPSIPEGFSYIRARRLLRTLRAGLELALQPLSKLLIPPRHERDEDDDEAGAQTDLSYPLALLYILQTEADMGKEISRMCRRVCSRTERLVAAGRAGVLLAPSTKTSTAIFLVSEVVDTVKTQMQKLGTWWRSSASAQTYSRRSQSPYL